jgi:predicted DNA repair protein MutK
MPSSLWALLDDIATMLDDVSLAAKKTAGVLGDDLALNAQQVTGLSAERELPVVWAVAKGSLKNKAILVPAALLISYLLPAAIIPLLMFGGAFLCFEGVEKLVHKFFPSKDDEAHEADLHAAAKDTTVDLVALEKERIKGAVRTDFILSAEIIAISLGVVAERSFGTQAGVLVAIALVMTVGVYGLVAGIVKLDDLGLHLSLRRGTRAIGKAILWISPWLMKLLSIAGTVAMFLVGGGILVHGIPWLHHQIEELTAGRGAIIETVGSSALEGVVGVIAGILALLLVKLAGGIWRMLRPAKEGA